MFETIFSPATVPQKTEAKYVIRVKWAYSILQKYIFSHVPS